MNSIATSISNDMYSPSSVLAPLRMMVTTTTKLSPSSKTECERTKIPHQERESRSTSSPGKVLPSSSFGHIQLELEKNKKKKNDNDHYDHHDPRLPPRHKLSEEEEEEEEVQEEVGQVSGQQQQLVVGLTPTLFTSCCLSPHSRSQEELHAVHSLQTTIFGQEQGGSELSLLNSTANGTTNRINRDCVILSPTKSSGEYFSEHDHDTMSSDYEGEAAADPIVVVLNVLEQEQESALVVLNDSKTRKKRGKEKYHQDLLKDDLSLFQEQLSMFRRRGNKARKKKQGQGQQQRS